MTFGDRTCFLVYETGPRVLELIASLPAVEIATPLPGILKISDGFFQQMDSGPFVGRACDEGVSVTMAPGLDPVSVQLFVDSVTADLITGAYRDAFLNFHVSDSSPRGLRWKEAIARVVSEEKNFTSMTVIVEETSFRLPALCFPENPVTYVMAIVAFLYTLMRM